MPDSDKFPVWSGWNTVRLIGRGSFGSVYEIERELFDYKEKAALKVICMPQSDSDIDELRDSGFDDESITATFRSHLENIIREYSFMKEMSDTANVVHCDDYRLLPHADGIGCDIYIKMELLTPVLKQLPPGEVPSDDMVIRLAIDMCKALVLCRKKNIIHRDIKPQNIFISKNGDFKLGDFGIAKTMERTTGGTKTGTYRYMAPEIYNNKPYNYSADLYSLGLVLHWFLNERRSPFAPLPPEPVLHATEEAARARRFSGEPLPPPVHGSSELKKIICKACAYDPKERYTSAEEMLADLLALKAGKPLPSEAMPERDVPTPCGNPETEEQHKSVEHKHDPGKSETKPEAPGKKKYRGPVIAAAAAAAAIAISAGIFGLGGANKTNVVPESTPVPTTVAEPANESVPVPSSEPSPPDPSVSEEELRLREQYGKAAALMDSGSYDEALNLLSGLDGYQDSAELAESCRQQLELKKRYQDAVALMNAGKYGKAIEVFAALGSFGDSAEKLQLCRTALLDEQYESALQLMNYGRYNNAITVLDSLNGYKDSEQLSAECSRLLSLEQEYSSALELMNTGSYDEAIEAFAALGSFGDSAAKLQLCRTALLDGQYESAMQLMNSGRYDSARNTFDALDGYRDSRQLSAECSRLLSLEQEYSSALELMNTGSYDKAIEAFAALGSFGDSAEKLQLCRFALLDEQYESAMQLMDSGRYNDAGNAFDILNGYRDSRQLSAECSRLLNLEQEYSSALDLKNAGRYNAAANAFNRLNGYKDSEQQSAECSRLFRTEQDFLYARRLLKTGSYQKAISVFEQLEGYKNSSELIEVCRDHLKLPAPEISPLTLSKIAAADWLVAAITENGDCVISGREWYRPDVRQWHDLVQLDAEDTTLIGVTAGGKVLCSSSSLVQHWDNISMADYSTDISLNLDNRSTGNEHIIALTAEGRAVACGTNRFGECNVESWDGLVKVAAGARHSVGLKADGTVVAVGSDLEGQLDVSGWKDMIDIAAVGTTTYGLCRNGTILVAGSGCADSVPNWPNVAAIKAGHEGGMDKDYLIGICSDGTIVTNRYGYNSSSDITSFERVTSVASGSWGYIAAICADGTVHEVGWDCDGERDASSWTGLSIPVN